MTEPVYAWTSNGRRLQVDLADARAHELIAADGDLNPLSLALWQQAVAAHPWALVVDIGVNYGEMLVGVDLPAGATVIGFEPNPTIRALAAQTFVDNALTVDLRPQAVSDHTGVARFAVDPDWSGMSSLGADGASPRHDVFEVPLTTLDDVVGGDVSSFCVKVDVEGFEAEVLAGAGVSLARAVPWVVMLECLHMPAGMLAGLAAAHAVLLLDRSDHRLVRAHAGDVDDLLASASVYPQDCLLVSAAALPLLQAGAPLTG